MNIIIDGVKFIITGGDIASITQEGDAIRINLRETLPSLSTLPKVETKVIERIRIVKGKPVEKQVPTPCYLNHYPVYCDKPHYPGIEQRPTDPYRTNPYYATQVSSSNLGTAIPDLIVNVLKNRLGPTGTFVLTTKPVSGGGGNAGKVGS